MMTDVKISEKRLKELEKAEMKLNALEAGGVDNWEWYGESLKGYRMEVEREEIIDDSLESLASAFLSNCYEPSERGAGWAAKDSAYKEAREVLNKLLQDLKELEDEDED